MAWVICPNGHNNGFEYDSTRVKQCPKCKATLMDKFEVDKLGREHLKARRAELNNAIEKIRR